MCRGVNAGDHSCMIGPRDSRIDRSHSPGAGSFTNKTAKRRDGKLGVVQGISWKSIQTDHDQGALIGRYSCLRLAGYEAAGQDQWKRCFPSHANDQNRFAPEKASRFSAAAWGPASKLDWQSGRWPWSPNSGGSTQLAGKCRAAPRFVNARF